MLLLLFCGPCNYFFYHTLRLNLVTRDKTKKAKAEGYAEGQISLVQKLPASQFLTDTEYLDLLANATEIVFDDKRVLTHPATNDVIKTSCQDIRVCGRREIRLALMLIFSGSLMSVFSFLRELLNWRKEIRTFLASLEPPKEANE